jgi:threonine/homoserine/homoserine lactone efflux protein
MIEAIVSGISLGLVLAILLGPVFFMLINTSIKKGFVHAFYLAIGVVISDAMFISVAYFSSAGLLLANAHKFSIGMGGGILLIIFGIYNFLKRPQIDENSLIEYDDSKSYLLNTLKGFMMNTLNPFSLVFWVGVSGTINAKTGDDKSDALLFFICVLTTVLATDLLKAYLAGKLKKIMRPGFLLWLNRLSGIGLMAVGIRMIYLLYA